MPDKTHPEQGSSLQTDQRNRKSQTHFKRFRQAVRQFARDFRAGTLRTKLLIAFLAVSLVSVGAIALYTNLTIRMLLQEQSASQLSRVAELQGASIGNLLTKEVELLQTAGLDDGIRKQAAASNASYQGSTADIQSSLLALDREWLAAVNTDNNDASLLRSKLDNPVADYLREYRQTYPENVEVFVTDRYGALLAASNRTSDYYQADEAWWQGAYNNGQGAIYFAPPQYDVSSHTYSIDIALPLYERGKDNVIGIVRTTLNLASVFDLLNHTQIGQTGRAEMLLPDNTFVTVTGTHDAPPELLTALSSRSGNISQVTWDGVPSFTAGALVQSIDPELDSLISGLGWRIVTHQSSAEVLGPAETQAGIMLIVTAVLAAIVIAVSLGLSQILFRPIEHLTAAAIRVREGDLTARAPVETKDEIGMLAITFNDMTSQLRNLIGSLEDRIQARTEQLRASADVGRTAVSVLNPNDLLRNVVNLITDRFGFYYAAVFIIDDSGRQAVLREATGEAGRALKARGHQLEVTGQSMVGDAITRRRPRIALDTGAEAVRFANPLLPDTRSEIALPLLVGDQVLGALDVQSTQEAAFDEASAAALQSMADQIAIAWSNALAYAEMQAVARRSRALFAASREVGQQQADLADTIRSTVQAAAAILEYNRWCVLTFNEVRTALVCVAAHNWPGLEKPLEIRTEADHPLLVSAQHEKELFINDADDEQLQHFVQAELSSLICVPVKTRGKLSGVLALSRPPGSRLTSGDLEVGRTLASLVAVAIENHNLIETSQRTVRELDEVNRSLTGQTWEKFMRRQERHEVTWVSHSEQLEPHGQPEVSEALTLGRIVTRPLTDGQLSVAVPIKLRDVPVGALRLIMPGRTWNSEMAAALDSIASHVAQASENARLLDETERIARREKAVADAADKIHRSTDIESVLQSAVSELRRITGRHGISVQLGFASRANVPAPVTLAGAAAGEDQATRLEGDRSHV